MGKDKEAGFNGVVIGADEVLFSVLLSLGEVEKKLAIRVLAFDSEVRRSCCFSSTRSMGEERLGELGAMNEAILLGIDVDVGCGRL